MDQNVSARGKIPVMILCGGMGTRLREETEIRPKPMVEIGGRPILWHIMKLYSAYGFKEFILCLGYKGHVIKEYFLNYKTYIADLTVQLGKPDAVQYHNSHAEEDWRVTLVETGQTAQTGARVACAGRYVQSDIFCLTYGDGLGNVDLATLIDFHHKHGKIGTITGVRPPGRFGELRVEQSGRAIEFLEKPQVTEGVINGGFFVFRREFLDKYLGQDDDLVLEHGPLQQLAKDGELMVYVHDGFWQPMDTYRELKLLEQLWSSGRAPWKMWGGSHDGI
jgi:glucose-1-phosphate cytidylyltransferase